MLPSKTIGLLLGVVFVLVGILGFVPNPLVSPDGIFAVNTMHNLVHIITGAVFIIGAQMGHARNTTIGIGIAYVAVAILGFLTSGDKLLGLVHINEADRWLHTGLAVAILAAGFLSTKDNGGNEAAAA